MKKNTGIMKNLRIEKYRPDLFEKWNKFVDKSINGTLFHRLDFLNYHKDKFKNDEHHLVFYKGQEILALLPMAIINCDGRKIAKSPFGASLGGVILKKTLSYNECSAIVNSFFRFIQENLIARVELTFLPNILANSFCDTFIFTLLENGFKIANSDIMSILNLNNETFDENFSTSVKRSIKKSLLNNIQVRFNVDIEDFWQVMTETFRKHNSNPTHSFKEWSYLCENFPDKIWCDVAYYENKPISGIGHISYRDEVDSSFYIANDPKYQEMQGLTLLIKEVLFKSRQNGFKFFDFGTSTANMKARENIFRFKESFGSKGVFRNTFIWDLDENNNINE